ncbi:tRNA-splicing ligase RtcB like protein [Cucumispora dikerogammari]|nr:tRNA-splicing ligase RtcB like protein [Cucumispora dikerogammari]
MATIYTFTKDPLPDDLKQLELNLTDPHIILGVTHPDLHGGVSLPVGSTVASLNHISPDAIGFDINCGVTVVDLKINLDVMTFNNYRLPLINLIKSNIFAGVGNIKSSGQNILKVYGKAANETLSEVKLEDFDYFKGFDGDIKFNTNIPIDNILDFGLRDLKASSQFFNTFYNDKGMEYFEFNGSVSGDSKTISQAAKSKGIGCLNSVGSGNHYIEIVHVSEINCIDLKEVLPFKKNSILGLIHSGSRGLGWQVCTEAMKNCERDDKSIFTAHSKVKEFNDFFEKKFDQVFLNEANKYKMEAKAQSEVDGQKPAFFITLRENGEATKKGLNYLKSCNSAMNYAYANRFLLANDLIRIFESVFKVKGKIFCDSSHNMGSIESFETLCKIFKGKIPNTEIHSYINKENALSFDDDIIVTHKKGSTNVLPPKFFNPNDVKYKFGMPYIIGGSCFTNSYMMFSTNTHLVKLCSDAHGSGRIVRRGICKDQGWNVFDLEKILTNKNTSLLGTEKEMITENGFCYKDINSVHKFISDAEPGTSVRSVRLEPLLVIKG